MQDDHLLTGTLADNIAFFDPQLDQRRIEQACRARRIHDDIMRMPMGYQSLISDMGAALVRRASASASCSPARSTAIRTPCSSTKAPPISTRRLRARSPT